MGSEFSRDGDAGVVAGPYLAQVSMDGFPQGRPLAAFLRERDRMLFLTAIRLGKALAGRDPQRVKAELLAVLRLVEGEPGVPA